MKRIIPFLLATTCILFLPAAACRDAADTAKDIGKTGAGILVDCTKAKAGAVATELGGLVEATVLDAVDSDGKVNWTPVKDLAKSFSRDVGWCALSTAVARILAPPASDPNAPKVAELQIDRAALRTGFAELKTELLGPGVTFKTADGEL